MFKIHHWKIDVQRMSHIYNNPFRSLVLSIGFYRKLMLENLAATDNENSTIRFLLGSMEVNPRSHSSAWYFQLFLSKELKNIEKRRKKKKCLTHVHIVTWYLLYVFFFCDKSRNNMNRKKKPFKGKLFFFCFSRTFKIHGRTINIFHSFLTAVLFLFCYYLIRVTHATDEDQKI